ncbi:MAG: hypothetical protein AVDCRST_MAG58-3648, partial [uncultured Rubrobacteraceae bacterium]
AGGSGRRPPRGRRRRFETFLANYFRECRQFEVRRIILPRLYEKGCEQRSDRDFGGV